MIIYIYICIWSFKEGVKEPNTHFHKGKSLEGGANMIKTIAAYIYIYIFEAD